MSDAKKAGPVFDILDETQMRRCTYLTALLVFLLPPFVGGTLMGFMGFYPLPEFYYIFLDYRAPLYVGAATLAGLVMVPATMRYIVGLTQLQQADANEKAKSLFRRLPWALFSTVTLYSIGGALIADEIIETMGIRDYTWREHLYNQLGVIPVVLITTYPIFFFFVDRLGRYLGPRGISVVALPMWVKILMFGILTPLLVESTMIGHHINELNNVEFIEMLLWPLLAVISIAGTWMAWLSLRQSMYPLEAFIASETGQLAERARLNLRPLSLDELGVLTTRFAELLTSQQQISGDLQRSQLLADSVIENAGALVLLLDREGRLASFNRACEQLSGYRFADVKGKPVWETGLLTEEVKKYTSNIFMEHGVSPQTIPLEFTNVWLSKDGTSHIIEWKNRLIFGEDGKAEFVISVGTDVTERNQANAKLRESEEKLNEAQRIAEVGNWELNLVSGQLFWSNEIFNLFEIDKAKFGATYEAFLNGIHPDDRDKVNQAYTNSLVTRSPYEVTHRLKMSDGRIKWVEERCYSEFDAEGKPLRSVGTVQDISKLKSVEQQLEKSESLFRTLAQVAPVGIFRTDPAGNCTYVNEHYCEISGLGLKDVLGTGWVAAIHPEDRALVAQKWAEAVANESQFSLEYRFQRPTGHVTWVVSQARAETDTHGAVLGYVGTITDINQRKHTETALQRMNEVLEQRVEQRTQLLLSAKEEAEQASRSKSLFLASMSHELRTPLNAILGYAQLMQIDTGVPRHILDNAGEIRRAGDYLLALMNDILDLARIESGRMEMQISIFELHDVITECQTQNNAPAENRNITIRCDESCGSSRVYADRLRLLQVLNNLVSNAIKYNSDGGQVTVSCRTAEKDMLRISVTDTGQGITPEKQAHLFEPFNRLGAEMGSIEGTGIGLVIARRLIESMDGRMGLESEPGKGSTFWIEVPVAGKEVRAAAQQVIARPPGDAKKIRVLVVEDYAANQMVLRLQLQTLGYEVDIASDGAAALNKWRAARHDLILTDVNMPVMDGLALTRAIRAAEQDSGNRVPIIAITAAAERSQQKSCIDAGMDEVLLKPIALESLREVMARQLGSKATPTTAETTAVDVVLDLVQLYRILGRVSTEQARELIATFLQSTSQGLDGLAQTSDAESLSSEMHKLKSSARTVGALRFAQRAEALERQAKQGVMQNTAAMLDGLRKELDEVEAAARSLHLDTRNMADESPPASNVLKVNCRSVMVVDDDLVVLQQMTDMLGTLGVAEVLTAGNGIEAIKLMSLRSSELEVLVCDLNMPSMDGVELIRKIGQTGFNGGIILMSGTDEKVLSTVSKLAGLQGLRVLGQAQKPVMPHQIAELLSHVVDEPKTRRPAFVAPVVTRDDIVAAMSANEFSVWFQPKVDALSLRPAGLEALARWKRADGKFIPPDIFITVAEHEGLIGELSKILVVAALNKGAGLFSAGFKLKVSINLSGRWLNDLTLPEFILANTLRAGLRAEDVILEVTETGVMEDVTTALDVLTRLRLKGFGLSIDDFGIGYSSFEQLGRIPFTELKLDRSFVNRAAYDMAAMAILESSMDMARKLGLSTVAEGVETQTELELIRSLGCDFVQGYFAAKPMPPDVLLDWLRER